MVFIKVGGRHMIWITLGKCGGTGSPGKGVWWCIGGCGTGGAYKTWINDKKTVKSTITPRASFLTMRWRKENWLRGFLRNQQPATMDTHEPREHRDLHPLLSKGSRPQGSFDPGCRYPQDRLQDQTERRIGGVLHPLSASPCPAMVHHALHGYYKHPESSRIPS